MTAPNSNYVGINNPPPGTPTVPYPGSGSQVGGTIPSNPYSPFPAVPHPPAFGRKIKAIEYNDYGRVSRVEYEN